MKAWRAERAYYICKTERNLIWLNYRAGTFTVTALIFLNMLTGISLNAFLGLYIFFLIQLSFLIVACPITISTFPDGHHSLPYVQRTFNFLIFTCFLDCFPMLVWMTPSCLVAAPKLFSSAFLRTQVSYPQIAIFKGRLTQHNKLSSLGFAKWSQVFDPLWLPLGMKWILWSEVGHT